MNPFVLGLLAMLLRQGILLLAGAIGIGPLVQAYVTDNLTAFEQMSLALAGALVTMGYAAYRHYKNRQVLATALASPWSMSEAEAKSRVRSPYIDTPSVTVPATEIPRLWLK